MLGVTEPMRESRSSDTGCLWPQIPLFAFCQEPKLQHFQLPTFSFSDLKKADETALALLSLEVKGVCACVYMFPYTCLRVWGGVERF